MSGKGQKCVGDIIGGHCKKCRKVKTLSQKLNVLKQYESNEKTCDITNVTSLNYAMLCTIHANDTKFRASYASATPLEVSQSSQAGPTIRQSMESRLATWIEDEAKRNSSANLTAINAKALSLFEDFKKDFPHEANHGKYWLVQ
jgi:hypothetical protein